MIRIAGVNWAYPGADSPCLDGMSLNVAPGEFLVLCGASGSGKSSALRLMNGLIPHFYDDGVLRGAVTVDGFATAVAELDEIGLRTGSVLQHPRRQFFTDSVPEEIAFAMENFGFPPERIRARVDAGISELAAEMPVRERLHRLSGGQQQRVAIAAASAHDPRILLLDEPSANLSTESVRQLAETLRGLKAAGITIVVAEHRLRYLEALADRVLVLRGGRIHRALDAERFRGLTDAELAAEGLRGGAPDLELPSVPASGPSTVGAEPVGAMPGAAGGALELDGILCRFSGRTVLAIDRAVFAAGEVTAIRGANGAGKSTLARVVAGLQRAAGEVRLDGRSLSPRQRQRACAIVMQDPQRQLFTESVAAEIDLARLGRRDRSGGPERTREVLDSLGLAHLAERHPLSLSGGEQQRLVVAAVRLAGRRIVIFDEPSSGVDRRHLESISQQIRQLADDGAIVLLISHDEDLLARAADRQLALAAPG